MSNFGFLQRHMSKSLFEMKDKSQDIDFVIQVLDARAINLTACNNEILKIYNKKILINIALKLDFANAISKSNDIIYISVLNKNSRQIIINWIKNKLKNKINSFKEKGLINPHFYGVVVGIPNVGKSSLIKLLSSKKKINIENRPGVTKNIQLFKINDLFSIYDTPGVLFKNAKNIEEIWRLAILGCVSKNFFNLDKIIEEALCFYFEFYSLEIRKYFGYNSPYFYESFLEFLINKYNFYKKNKEPDRIKCLNFLFNIFLNNKICKINYEKKNK